MQQVGENKVMSLDRRLVTLEPIRCSQQILFVTSFTQRIPTFYLNHPSHVDFRFINIALIHTIDLFTIRSNGQHSSRSTKQSVDPPSSINHVLDPMIRKDIGCTICMKNTRPIRWFSLSIECYVSHG